MQQARQEADKAALLPDGHGSVDQLVINAFTHLRVGTRRMINTVDTERRVPGRSGIPDFRNPSGRTLAEVERPEH